MIFQAFSIDVYDGFNTNFPRVEIRAYRGELGHAEKVWETQIEIPPADFPESDLADPGEALGAVSCALISALNRLHTKSCRCGDMIVMTTQTERDILSSDVIITA